MILKKEKITTFLFYIYFILFLVTLFDNPFGRIYSNYSILINLGILFILFLNEKNKIINNSKNILIFIGIMFISLISVAFNSGGMGSLLNILSFMLGVLVFNNIIIDKKKYKFLIGISWALFLYMFYLSFSVWNAYLSGISFLNPNSVALYLLFSTLILDSNIKNGRISILLFPLCVYAIYLTECRSAIFACIIYLLITRFSIIRNFVIKHRKVILYSLVFLGTIFPLIYTYLYENGITVNLSFSTKSLYTGREVLWMNMLTSLKREPYSLLFGLGTNYVTEIGVIANFHNWYFGVLFTFGILNYFLYFIFLIYNISSKINIKIFASFIAIFIMGFFESMALSSMIQVVFYILFLVSNYHDNRVNTIREDSNESIC